MKHSQRVKGGLYRRIYVIEHCSHFKQKIAWAEIRFTSSSQHHFYCSRCGCWNAYSSILAATSSAKGIYCRWLHMFEDMPFIHGKDRPPDARLRLDCCCSPCLGNGIWWDEVIGILPSNIEGNVLVVGAGRKNFTCTAPNSQHSSLARIGIDPRSGKFRGSRFQIPAARSGDRSHRTTTEEQRGSKLCTACWCYFISTFLHHLSKACSIQKPPFVIFVTAERSSVVENELRVSHLYICAAWRRSERSMRSSLVALLSLSLLCLSQGFQPSNINGCNRCSTQNGRNSLTSSSLAQSLIETAPYDDIIPFLSEHVQQSDQILFVGATTDLSLQMVKSGYGTKNTGILRVVDSNKECLNELEQKLKLQLHVSDHSCRQDIVPCLQRHLRPQQRLRSAKILSL